MFIHTNIDAYNQNLFTCCCFETHYKIIFNIFSTENILQYMHISRPFIMIQVFLFFFCQKNVFNIFATFNIFILHLHSLIYLFMYFIYFVLINFFQHFLLQKLINHILFFVWYHCFFFFHKADIIYFNKKLCYRMKGIGGSNTRIIQYNILSQFACLIRSPISIFSSRS